MNRTQHVEAQIEGDEGVEAYAARVGISTDELREWKTLYLAGGRGLTARRSKSRRALWLTAAAVVAALAPATVYAVNCSQTLPWPLKTFCPDSPAIAADVNQNFQVLAKTLLDRTGGGLDGGINIVQTNTSRLLSSDNVVRLGGTTPTVQLQLDTSSNGSGAALFVDNNDKLFVNSGGTFSQGTEVQGALTAAGAFTASSGATINNGAAINGVATFSSPVSLNAGMAFPLAYNCHDDWGSYANTVGAMRYAQCHPGEYVNAVACRIDAYDGIGVGKAQCVARCCRVTNDWPTGPNPSGTDF